MVLFEGVKFGAHSLDNRLLSLLGLANNAASSLVSVGSRTSCNDASSLAFGSKCLYSSGQLRGPIAIINIHHIIAFNLPILVKGSRFGLDLR